VYRRLKEMTWIPNKDRQRKEDAYVDQVTLERKIDLAETQRKKPKQSYEPLDIVPPW
jgi:hypothetical protein